MGENESFQKRVGGLRIFVGLLFGLLITRLWFLQIAQGERYHNLSRRNSIKRLDIPAPRGIILDRNGQVLATNTSSYQLCVLPATRSKKEKETLALSVSNLLSLPYDKMLEKLEGRDIPRYSPIILKADLTQAEIQKVEENLLCSQNVFVRRVSTRFYPQRSAAAHVIGYVGEASPEDEGDGNGKSKRQWAGLIVGKEGVEKSLQELLAGQQGVEEVQVDAAGRLVELLAKKPEVAGAKVVLTIDLELQKATEKALGNRTGCAIFLDPRSGEILALASSPGFNLQDRSNWGDLLKDESHPFINRAFMSRYPPGSVFKIVTLFAALEAGFASERTTFFCSGTYEVGNRIFRCWKRSGHGQIDLLRAVAESCDVFFYQLGQKVGIERIIGAAKKLGMVDKTGIDLPGEISSVIPGAAWKQEHYGSPWYAGDTVNAAVGQGFINVTPLSIAVLTAAVANQGKIVTPHVVKEVKGASRAPIPTRLETEKVRPLQAKASTWDIIRTGMRAAVASPTGTAHVADLSSVAVAGKTGSAQTKPGTPTHAWFVCFAPYENPEVVCVVVVEQGGYGGEMAAPIARQVLEAYFSRGRTANNSPQTNEGKGPSPLPAVVKPPASLKGNGNSR